ncbi:hypothetical protein [Helicobacter sp. T3_23-1056]
MRGNPPTPSLRESRLLLKRLDSWQSKIINYQNTHFANLIK